MDVARRVALLSMNTDTHNTIYWVGRLASGVLGRTMSIPIHSQGKKGENPTTR